ncbi:MAG: hypothetical protein MZV70_48835 [Desulfobacterales bacterium]|nr:hypothetical protein [Desulfobacterales bacterium]
MKGDIACVLGASMIARADLIRRIGGFDEEFMLYGEDQDLPADPPGRLRNRLY